jgi:hypothetical protein
VAACKTFLPARLEGGENDLGYISNKFLSRYSTHKL